MNALFHVVQLGMRDMTLVRHKDKVARTECLCVNKKKRIPDTEAIHLN